MNVGRDRFERPPGSTGASFPPAVVFSRWTRAGYYVDEGEGPPLLMLYGDPTWSLLYRCVALGYPGFGLPAAREDYGFTLAEHVSVVERAVFLGPIRALAAS